MTGETDVEIPDTGAVFTFGKSKIANNVPSRLWLKNDIPVHISCGQSHSAFVTEEGRLFVFGNNNRGQLGLKTKGAVTKPICVKVLNAEKVRFVACGTDHTLVSTSQWEVFAVGGNSDGQLGLGHCHNSVTFQRLHPFCDYAPIKRLCAGGHTSAALTEDGRLFLWGDNSVGQLGLGNESPVLLPKELKVGQPIQWVSCGYRHSALVTDNGDVFTFGESAEGRLGLSANQLVNHIHPQRVDSLRRVLQVACGGKHTLALTEDELYSFGRGEYGQLGLGTLVFLADLPVAVGHFRKGRVTHVMCGEHHSALITDSGLLYTFGDGRHGKLGLGDENFTNQFRPTVCQRFFDYSVMSVACGSSHTLVFARPRQKESKEVCLEDEDVTYSYLDRCYNSMLQGQPLEHIPDPTLALGSQHTFLSASLPTSHRWSLSTRSRRRQRESSSAQFGPKFKALPPIASNFTSLALTCNILLPRSPAGTPKRLKTEVPEETLSTSVTMPVTTVTNNGEVGVAENSMSDKKDEQNEDEMPRSSSIERVELRTETVPQQALPTKLLSGYVSHPSMSVSSPTSNLKRKKAKSRHSLAEERSSVLASQSEVESKTCKKTIQSENKEVKSQPVEVKYSSNRMSGEVIQEAKSSPVQIQHTISQFDPDEVKQVRTSPTKVTEKQQNSTPVKITSQSQNIPKKENGKNDVDTEKTPLTPTSNTSKKRRSDVKREGNIDEQSPVQKNITGIIETAMKTPRPPSLFIPTEREGQPWRERAYGMSKGRTRKPTEVEKVQFRPEKLEQETTGIKKRQTSNKTIKNSDIFFPPIKSRQSAGKGPLEKSKSLSNLQSDHTKNHSEQKQEFPFIKRDHLSSGQWSNNQSESTKLVKKEPVLGTDTSNSGRTSQAEQSIVGSTVLSLPTLANAAAIPLLIKAAEVFSETLHINHAPKQNPEIPLCSSTLVLGDTKGNNIVPEEEEDQNSVLQDMSAIDKDQETDDSSAEQHEDVNDKPFSDKKENWKSGNGEREDEEDGMEREEDGGKEEYLAEEHHNERVVKDKENSPSKYKEEEKGESKDDEDSGDQENTEDTEKECEKDERENKESKSAEEEKEDSNTGQSSEDEEEKSKREGSENEHEREENENKTGEEVEKEEKERQESGDEETKEEHERVTENETFREEDKGEEIDEEEEEDSKSDEDKAEECGDDEEEKEEEERDEKESWNEGGEKEAEKETNENTDVEEEDESSNDWLREKVEKTEGGQESECKAEDKSQGSDEQEEEKESKENEEEEEENETGEEDENTSEGESDRDEDAGEEEEQEESEEEDTVGNENEQESQEEEHDNEEEEEKIQEKGKEEEENEEEESEEEEDDKEEEEGDNEDSEEQKDTDDKGINNREEDKEDGEEKEDSEREEKIKTNQKMYDKRKDKKQRKIKGNKNYEANSEEDEADQREEVVRNYQRKEEGKEKIDSSEEFKEEETMEISETQESEEHEEEEIESEEEAKNEEEEETTQKEKYLRKQKATNSEEEKQEEESREDEEEEAEEEEEEAEEEAEEEEEEAEKEEGEAEEEEEKADEEEEESEEEEEEADEEEEESEEEAVEESEEEAEEEEEEAEEEEEKTEEEEEKTEEEEKDYEEEEEEEEKDKQGRSLKQRVRATSLPMSKQSIKQTKAERDRPKTGIKNKKNLKEKKQKSSGAQDLQFWNNVLPQYLNLK